MTYLKEAFHAPTPQSEVLPGRDDDMVRNTAGGVVYAVDDFARLRRFLVLGSEGGSYYAGERQLTLDNAAAVKRSIATDGQRVIDEVVRASNGVAPRNGPCLFVLAMAASFGNDDARRAAFAVLPDVARTGSHLFQFVEYVDGMRGWGKGLRNAIGAWYEAQGDVSEAAYQVVKYRQRNGWTHRDLLRKAHPSGRTHPELDVLYGWLTQGTAPPENDRRYDTIRAYEYALENAERPELVADAIRRFNMTWEMVPGIAMGHREVWEALYEKMPMTAMIRNLGTLTRLGILAPMSEAATRVTARVNDADSLRAARVHPIAILSALMTYRQGRSVRGSNSWTPVSSVVDALDIAFEKSFTHAPQTSRRFYLGIDVSGSMAGGTVAGVPGLTPRMAAAAMAMAIARRESNYHMAAFADATGARRFQMGGYDMMPLDITASDSLADAMAKTNKLPWGGTDCALPMLDAMKRNIAVDCFVILTDSETRAGEIHPAEALRQYRDKTGISAKLAVVAMTSNGFTIADPDDGGMLDVVGFDASAPQVIADFATA